VCGGRGRGIFDGMGRTKVCSARRISPFSVATMILTMDAWGHNNMSASETAAKKAYDVVFKDMAEMNADLERVHKSSNSPLHALCCAPLCCAPLLFQSGISLEIFAESAAT
jgi:hypothetical protein